MARKKHIPQRTCIACREAKAKRELIRIVRTSDHQVIIDESGKQQGRGAYLCKEAACWEQGLSTNLLRRALKVAISNEDMSVLQDYAVKLG